tara:strand:- start:438 stop:878 length:441 start_codon:yes stop_codon:yes gene_type:complete
MKSKQVSSPFKIFEETKKLKFKCTGCGQCCTGSPGYVWLTEVDIQRIADKLNITKKYFLQKYTLNIAGRYSLKEIQPSYDCIFYKNKRCTIYQARPKQCRTYPFWDDILSSKKNWDAEKKYCEGIDHREADEFTRKKVENMLNFAE